jgi:predicted anti-sigma-YlaC factor YlaD
MDCPEVRDSLEAFGAGELDAAATAQVRQHLESCVDCSLYGASLRELVADLRQAGHAVRYLQPFSLPEVVVPKRRSRSVRVAWAFAAVCAAWTVLATVLVVAPSVSVRLSAFPAGKALRDARVAAQANDIRSQRLAAANALLAQKLTADRLGVPLAAVQVVQRYLADQGAAALGVQLQTELKWTLIGAIASHLPSSDASPTTVRFTAAVSFPPGAGTPRAAVRLQVQVARSVNGEWSVVEAKP